MPGAAAIVDIRALLMTGLYCDLSPILSRAPVLSAVLSAVRGVGMFCVVAALLLPAVALLHELNFSLQGWSLPLSTVAGKVCYCGRAMRSSVCSVEATWVLLRGLPLLAMASPANGNQQLATAQSISHCREQI